MINANHKNKGFTLVEVVIAISLFTFGIVSVYSAFTAINASTFNISARFTAAYLAQEGIEVIRNLRDNNFINNTSPWSLGLTGSPCASGCNLLYNTATTAQLTTDKDKFLTVDSYGTYTYTGPTTTIFKRVITITPIVGTTDVLNVSAVVTWSYNNKNFSFTTSEYLYNWY